MHHPVFGRQVVGQGLRLLASQSSSATFSSFRAGPVASDKVWTPSPALVSSSQRLLVPTNWSDCQCCIGNICQRRFNSTIDESNDDEEFMEDEVTNKEGGGGGDAWMSRREADIKDRTRPVPLETALKYMDSAAYKQTYGDSKVWELYRRNFANTRNRNPWTRRKCIVYGKVSGGNPCPICRDEYLVVHYKNTKLISQFLTDYNAQMVERETSGVCREQYSKLEIAIEKAKDMGLLDIDAPFVEYDYQKYMPKQTLSTNS